MAQTPENRSISPEMRPAIEALERFAASAEVARALRQAQDQALQALKSAPKLAASAVAVDPFSFGVPVPAQVASIRVVVTREAEGDGIERHANCTQYLYTLDGPLQTHVQTGDAWRIDRYGYGNPSLLEDRWHVVPPGLWHRTVAPGQSLWSVVALHTARDVQDEHR